MKGFAALTSVIIIGAVLIVVGSAVVLTSINEGQMSLSNLQSNSTSALVDACAEDSLLFINEQSLLPSTISSPLGNCSVTINSQVGTSWDYNLIATQNNYTRTLRIKLSRGTQIDIGSWQEQ